MLRKYEVAIFLKEGSSWEKDLEEVEIREILLIPFRAKHFFLGSLIPISTSV